MKKNILIFIACFGLVITAKAQEFECTVTVDAQQTGDTQLSIFKTLENAVEEFITDNSWTDLGLDNQEKLNCSVFINISNYDSDNFEATIQVQSSRPVYGSTMATPILNIKDNNFSFSYTEHELLAYNPNSYDSNLISTISFYIYTILGMDADTFAPEGGTQYHEEARQIVNTAQQSNRSGWKASDGNQSRFRLNADILSSNFSGFREAMYVYHRKGLDMMHDDVKASKEKIVEAIELLRQVNNSRPNSVLMRSFFDAKSDEVEKIFSDGPSVPIADVVENLNRIAPLYGDNWKNISY